MNHMGQALSGLFIGVGVLGGGYFAADAFKEVKLANQMLTVKGFASKDVVADHALGGGSVKGKGATKQDAYENLLASKDKVATYLKSKGFKDADVSYGQLSMWSTHKMNDKGMSTNEIEHYNASMNVSFESSDVVFIQKIAKDAEVLIKDGVGYDSHRPHFLFSKLDDLKIELLGEAAKDAKARAQELSSKVGGKIGGLRSAKQGVFQITSRNDASVSGGGEYDTSSINKTVKAVVTMSFATS